MWTGFLEALSTATEITVTPLRHIFLLSFLFVCLFVSVNQKTPLDVDLYFVAGKLRYQLDFKLASLTRHTTKYCVGHLLKNAKVNEFFTFSIALFTILEPFCKPNC